MLNIQISKQNYAKFLNNEIIVYFMVGVISAAIYMVLSTLFVQIFLWNYRIATTTGLLISAAFSYYGHFYLTFASPGSHGKNAPRFLTQLSLMTGLNALVVEGVTKYTIAPIWIATGIVVVTFPAQNFLFYKVYTFKKT